MRKNRCKRCNHEWIKRMDVPVRCPKCGSPYWDKDLVLPSRKKVAWWWVLVGWIKVKWIERNVLFVVMFSVRMKVKHCTQENMKKDFDVLSVTMGKSISDHWVWSDSRRGEVNSLPILLQFYFFSSSSHPFFSTMFYSWIGYLLCMAKKMCPFSNRACYEQDCEFFDSTYSRCDILRFMHHMMENV